MRLSTAQNGSSDAFSHYSVPLHVNKLVVPHGARARQECQDSETAETHYLGRYVHQQVQRPPRVHSGMPWLPANALGPELAAVRRSWHIVWCSLC